MKRLKKLRKDIAKEKTKLKEKARKEGLHENFGQKEVRKLRDKHGATPYGDEEQRQMDLEIDQFEDWAMELDLDEF